MYFEDAVHQLHTTSTWYALQFRGKHNTKVLESNTGRDRYTILWAINPKDWEFISVQTKFTCNTELMKSLLLQVKQKHTERLRNGKKIYIILDNARYQNLMKYRTMQKNCELH
jgi:hypothetical protein